MNAAEILAAIQAFNLLEPEVQKGIVALIHLLAKPKQPPPPPPVFTPTVPGD
jgi:hypothetical protein